MAIKYSKRQLHRLEDLIAESPYLLRYEKGNFKPGYCILNTKKVAIVNKYFSVEGKINCLIDIINSINIDPELLSEKKRKLFLELNQTELNL